MADPDLRTPAADVDLVREGRLAVRDIELAYFEWGRRAGPTVLMLHATGFHARCWDGVIRAMAESMHIIAVDQRGHGRSTKTPPYNWAEFGADAAAAVEALDLGDIIGVGHSMGGHAIVQAAGTHPDRFRALLLIDPVILDPVSYTRPAPFRSALEHPVSRRRNRWTSPGEMFERFKDRHPFSLWEGEILMDYCRFGLVPDDEGFVLGCPPEVEASIYMGSAGRDIRNVIGTLSQPVVVLRAKGRTATDQDGGAMDFSRSPTWPGLAAAFPNGRDVHHPELSHFMPMQAPVLVAGQIASLASDEFSLHSGRGRC
ncbi:MAG: alpha/beta hydrolase [Gammaproteobacteria bacterium]|nr:alpha/beta hydrolase [Gammaproteobacteria bacterium]